MTDWACGAGVPIYRDVLHERARNQELADSVTWHRNEQDRRNMVYVIKEQGLEQRLKEKDEMLRGQLGHARALPAFCASMLMPAFVCVALLSLGSLVLRLFVRKQSLFSKQS